MKEHTRGGKRQGAGRKSGVATKKTREIVERVIADGITPLDYLLRIMRDENGDPEMRMEAAKSSAPYIHPRLSSIDAKVSVNKHEEALCDLE